MPHQFALREHDVPSPPAMTRAEQARDTASAGESGTLYGTSPLKRVRRTEAEIKVLDDAVLLAVATETPITVRGAFYRVVSAGAVEKSERGYSAVQRRLLALRRDGRVPYTAITDGTRLRMKPDSWTDIDEMLADAASSYRRALWNDQDVEVILMSEKDAISGVVYPVTAEFDVELCITRGYSSETFTHSVAQTVLTNDDRGKRTIIYQLGDHDPSGVDGWREFREKVQGFTPNADVEFERLAVTPEQIEMFGLPTRPTKRTDSRSAGFVGESVEVDAIPPSSLRAIVRQAIEQHVDPHRLRLTQLAEQSERNILAAMSGRWSQ